MSSEDFVEVAGVTTGDIRDGSAIGKGGTVEAAEGLAVSNVRRLHVGEGMSGLFWLLLM